MTATTYTLETEYQIKYTTKQPVPIPEIIESLRALERLAKRTPPFLERHYKHIHIVDTQVFVETIESGSLLEKLKIQYVFGTEENYEKAQELATSIMADSPMIETLVAFGMGALAMYGVAQLIKDKSPSKHVEAYNNHIINIGGTVDLKAEDITAILDSVKDKKSLARDAVNLVKPAKSDPEATIEVAGHEMLEISPELIAEVPDEYEIPKPAEKTERYQNVKVLIFASDQDKSDNGWAGAVPNIADTRVNFKLADSVSPNELHGRKQVQADIEVLKVYQPAKKKYKVKSITLLLIN